MEEFCRNCQHFESKGFTIDRKTYGLCKKFEIKGKPGVFRWGDSGCVEFRAGKETAGQQKTKIIP